MFSFFTKNKVSATDLIWLTQGAKKNGLLKLLEGNRETIVAAWFRSTQSNFSKFMEENGVSTTIRLAFEMSKHETENRRIILLENYPLWSKEQEMFRKWNAMEIVVLNSLDEPLFQNFGGEQIAGLMKKLGVSEDESLSHSLITKSIGNAQKKLDRKVQAEFKANSAEGWFELNMPSDKN